MPPHKQGLAWEADKDKEKKQRTGSVQYTSTHIWAKSFNVFATFSNYSSSILKWTEKIKHFLFKQNIILKKKKRKKNQTNWFCNYLAYRNYQNDSIK